MIRASFVEICGGDVVASQLLNEALFVTENRISSDEPEWFQRKGAYWVAALQGATSERTIRDTFKKIKALGLMEIQQANGDQRGSFYKLNVERLQSEIDKLGADTLSVEETPAELSTTPAKMTGVHAWYIHARENLF